jgi:aspartate/glutamate racemase
MKAIGILGGIGPQATMDFEQHIHRVAQQLIPHTPTAAIRRWWSTITATCPSS